MSITKICLICGNPFIAYPCEIKVGRAKYCSKKCQQEWQRKQIYSDIENGNYKSKLEELEKDMTVEEYNEYRKRVE